jgi:hypothetical protein
MNPPHRAANPLQLDGEDDWAAAPGTFVELGAANVADVEGGKPVLGLASLAAPPSACVIT